MEDRHQIAQMVERAKQSPEEADELIIKYMGFIKAETARFIKRAPLEGVDDELGIAMLAFYEAVLSYEKYKGTFLKYASTAIRRRLIDNYRREKRHRGQISLYEGSDSDDDRGLIDTLGEKESNIAKREAQLATKHEIDEFSAQLTRLGVELSDVADNCPKQERTFRACLSALEYAKKNPALLDELVTTGRLPIAELSRGSGVERKTLERHRKYLVAIMVAYTNGYEIIRGHLCQMERKESRR